VLELARRSRRFEGFDLLLRDESQVSLKFESGRLKETALRQEAGLNFRGVSRGKVGIAGTTDLSGDAALEDLLQEIRAAASVSTRTTIVLSTPYENRPLNV
jgi:predicted Zn-dependent protease